MQHDASYITDLINQIYPEWEENAVSEADALRPDLAGLRLFDTPICGIADAADPMFKTMRKPEAVGPWFRLPDGWLDGAKSVISIFFPFSEEVKAAERLETDKTCDEWLHGRVEGHAALVAFTQKIADLIEEEGFKTCIPTLDPRFAVTARGAPIEGITDIAPTVISSNWSERHVAFISGLGTFSLTRALITRKGMAGRLCSIVTTMPIKASERAYTGIYEWCIRCGACVRRCPVQAISLEEGKKQFPCAMRIEETKKQYAPRYGCGQCQTSVPCESCRP